MGEQAAHTETPAERHNEHSNGVGTHELVRVTMLAIELPPNDTAPGEYNPPPPPPDLPPRNCPQQLLRNAEPVSTHPLAPTIPSHAAISAPTPTLSSHEAPSLNANQSHDHDATQTRAEQIVNDVASGEYHPPPEHLMHDTVDEHDTHAVLFGCREEGGGDTASQLPEGDAIGQLTHELNAQWEDRGAWAAEIERELEGTTQGEYIQAGCYDTGKIYI